MQNSKAEEKKITVLVAEDQNPISSLIEYKLKSAGYDVIITENGMDALDIARKIRPEIILLDVMMPFMTGFEVLSELKRDNDLAVIPVIILTAQTNEEDILKGLELGADDYILKPFSPNELVARIKTVLLRHKRFSHKS